jgi:lipopolysaccharide exporter
MSRFATNVLKLVSGSLIAQILGVLLVPIISRLYAPEDLGVLNLFLSISGILVVVSCLSYQLAIMLPKDDEDSINITVLCFVLVCITSLISGGVFILFSDDVGALLNTPEISDYLFLLPAAIFLSGLFLIMNYWLSRKVRFGTSAAAQVSDSLSTKAVQIGAGISTPSPLGLIVGYLVGYVAALLVMFRGIRKDLSLLKHVSLCKIKEMASRYRRFPMFSSWSALANSASLQVAPLMLAPFFGPAVVGFYGMAHMVVNMPMSLVGSATGRVFFQKASEAKNRTGSVRSIVREVHQRLVSIGVFPILVLMIVGEELFALVLGTQWAPAGEYARILAPWLLFVFISSPLSTIFSILERQHVSLSFNVLILISRVVALYVGGIFGGPILALTLYSITGILFWGWMNFYILRVSGVSFRAGVEDLLKYALLAIIVSIPLFIAKYLSVSIAVLLAIIVVVTGLYYAIIISRDPILKKEVRGILPGFKP